MRIFHYNVETPLINVLSLVFRLKKGGIPREIPNLADKKTEVHTYDAIPLDRGDRNDRPAIPY